MEEKMAIEKIRNAVEIATKKIILLDDEYNINENLGGIIQHEHHLNAMIYHEMISSGYFSFNDIIMESRYVGTKERVDFEIDHIFNSNNDYEVFFIEVKQILYDYENETEEIPVVIDSVFSDVKKLQNDIHSDGRFPMVPVMIIVNLTRYPVNYPDYKPMNKIISHLKKLLSDGEYSDNFTFIISDIARAITITAGEIRDIKHEI
ncbi:hypothetical protein [Ferroplasma sp.]|jgi:hypothetical protein|uniref:hypothetical protein n=1 Tax=Ferroplasma sp. TaxID=2591003 RepID=UPI00262D721C|nr:hypothetical protein [Ferroplasma sp.]